MPELNVICTWYHSVVELSRRHLAVKLVLCRAEVQEVLGYLWALCHETVLFPTGSATLYDQFAPLKDRKMSSMKDIMTKGSCEKLNLTSKLFTPVDTESVSLQRKRLVTVRMWFFISYTMIPLAQTPKTNSPTMGLFSLPTRWNITPYSGNCWAIWRTELNTFALRLKLFTVRCNWFLKNRCKYLKILCFCLRGKHVGMACMQSWQLLFNSGQSQFLQHPFRHIMFWLVIIFTIQLKSDKEPNQILLWWITLVFQRCDLYFNPSYLWNIVSKFNL